ncbi:hypothetical protein AVEN_169273-1 [Araneus ventricosus]|uniref:Transposase Tc1-like domain-containing protein n=1 Tax=Araneus ventricosus TaxID=182803 RepID=A0A4Y2PUY9_ARAVE|nr:hypothetical protein AVEN_169273-1 [Araneus ventricosus]
MINKQHLIADDGNLNQSGRLILCLGEMADTVCCTAVDATTEAHTSVRNYYIDVYSNRKECFSKTFRMVLRKTNYNGIVAITKPLISKVIRDKRIAFAKKHILGPEEFWNKVIFRAKHKFDIFGSNYRIYAWLKPDSELLAPNTILQSSMRDAQSLYGVLRLQMKWGFRFLPMA